MKSIPVLTFFNNKGGVGKTSLVYHLAWMLTRIGHRVLTCDLDPQANLTAAFLDESALELLWNTTESPCASGRTIFQCVNPLMKVGDVVDPDLTEITSDLSLIPGNLALSGFEDTLSVEWPQALGSGDSVYRALRILSAFSLVMQEGARAMNASVVLADIGPNLGAINRAALIATDHVIVPLAADLFSLQGLRNLGPTLRQWRKEWEDRRKKLHTNLDFPLPCGRMRPVGYVVQQHGVRLGRPVRAYDKWVNRMPEEYAGNLLAQEETPDAATPAEDAHCLATVKHYRSLVPMAQEHRKPIFDLTPADGAIGSHAQAARNAYDDFEDLARRICEETKIVPQ